MTDVKIYCFVFPGDSLPSEAQVRAALKAAYEGDPRAGDRYPVHIVRVADVDEMNGILHGSDTYAIIVTAGADELAKIRTGENPPIIVC